MRKQKFFKLQSRGRAVSDIQRRLKKIGYFVEDEDSYFGESTQFCVKQFQQDRGLLVDGVVGPETWQDLVEASYILGSRTIYLKKPPLVGDDIKTVQLWLRTVGFNPGPVDAVYGRETMTALKEFQHNIGLKNDGILSTESIEAFLNLRTALEKNVEVDFPHHDTDPQSSLASLEKQIIMIDYGHGGSDYGAIGPTGLPEDKVCENIALRVGNLFKILGTDVLFTKKPGQGITTARRIELINKSKSSFVISIHLNHSTNTKAEGSCCYYFSSGKHSSSLGKKLANFLHREQMRALGLEDCRVHGKNFNILRLTKIPAVIVEPAFITNPKEETLLRKPLFRQKIASAIFDGLMDFSKDQYRENED